MYRRKNRKIFTKFNKKLSRWGVSSVIFLFIICFFCVLFFIHDLPDLNTLESKGRRASVVFESYDGKIIATYGDLFGNIIHVDNIPKYIGNAVIAIEDRRFFKHHGIDIAGIARAVYMNIIHGKIVQGGSTLTQQLAKNLFLSPDRSIKRKIQELILAFWLEKKFSKKQILTIYLNRVYFGACAYGIDAAAHRYFGKSAQKLTLYEAAKLAGILKAPSTYSPFYNTLKSNQRTETVLQCMVDEKYITETDMKEALIQKDNIGVTSTFINENRYFTDWVLEQLGDIFTVNDDVIVRTTLDSRLQANATYTIRSILAKYGFQNRASQMALVSLDRTGAVRAMVGGHTYGNSQFNRVLAVRSFGSAFKYFVFLAALENGMDICDSVSDLPITIGTWSPKNYGYKSIGQISLEEAFIKSVNTSTVRLAQKIGMQNIIKKAEQLGVKSEISKNLASALGASGMTLLELTASYEPMMIDGHKITPFGIISIKTPKGKYLYRARQRKNPRIISHDICEKMKKMMHEVSIRGTGKKAKIQGIDCFVKTGTSNDSRDASIIGFIITPIPLITGIWVGNDDNTPMSSKITGGTLPAIAWKEFMSITLGLQKPLPEIQLHNKQAKHKKRIIDILNTVH